MQSLLHTAWIGLSAQTEFLCCASVPQYVAWALLQNDMEREVEGYLRRKYEANLQNVEVVWREDLDLVGGAVTLQGHVAVSGLLLHGMLLSTPTWGWSDWTLWTW